LLLNRGDMPERLPPLNALHAFEVAGRRLSFTAAADELNVTPGAVSRQVKLLEQHLGVQLFERGYRKVSLTTGGRAFHDALSDAFGQIGAASRRLVQSHRDRPLTIFASMMFTMRWLMPRLGSFEGTGASGIRLTTSLVAVPDPFGGGDVDAAIYLGHDDWPGMRCHRLIEGKLLPICSPALLRHRPLRRIGDLQHHALLHSLVFPDNWKNWLSAAGRPDITGASSLAFGSSSLAYQAAIEGMGVALGQAALIREDVASGRLVTPLARSLQDGSAYILAYPDAAGRNPGLESFIVWLRKLAAADRST
jgi:LysR family transcriptional regulator, glycine cleavage system transcriptional activator